MGGRTDDRPFYRDVNRDEEERKDGEKELEEKDVVVVVVVVVVKRFPIAPSLPVWIAKSEIHISPQLMLLSLLLPSSSSSSSERMKLVASCSFFILNKIN